MRKGARLAGPRGKGGRKRERGGREGKAETEEENKSAKGVRATNDQTEALGSRAESRDGQAARTRRMEHASVAMAPVGRAREQRWREGHTKTKTGKKVVTSRAGYLVHTHSL